MKHTTKAAQDKKQREIRVEIEKYVIGAAEQGYPVRAISQGLENSGVRGYDLAKIARVIRQGGIEPYFGEKQKIAPKNNTAVPGKFVMPS